jgi:hypothetical protein
LKALAAVPGIAGIKEYYGLAPDREDPNLRMTSLFFENPDITEQSALSMLAQPYGTSGDAMVRFWQLTSEGMELFPWETSWFIREVGRSRVDHSLSAAILRGMDCPTPSWRSTRYSIFMRVEPAAPPHPWMLEDVQLRCELAAQRMARALELGNEIDSQVPRALSEKFTANLADLARFYRRASAYAYHLRETNLATILQTARQQNQPAPEKAVNELLQLMKADYENYRAEQLGLKVPDPPASTGNPPQVPPWKEMDEAISLLRRDVDKFLSAYFHQAPDQNSKGIFSVTSP